MSSGTGVAKWPPRYAPNCEHSEPNPICKSPAARRGAGRLSSELIAPAVAFDITMALPKVIIMWVPNSQLGT